MEHNDRRQRQNNPPSYAAQQGLVPSSAQYPTTSASDRFRQPPLTDQPPTSAPSAGRAGNTQGYNYGYAEGAQFVGSSISAGDLQYQADYAQSAPGAQQQYPQYGSNMMYNVPSQQQATVQSAYEPVQPYPPRHTAAIEVLSTQFGVPQQYYMEGGPTSAPAMATQNIPAQYPALSYTTQSPVGRQPLASAYAGGMADPAQGSAQPAYPQANYAAQTAADLDVAYGQYQQELRRTFEFARDGRLSEASNLLVHISDWLLGNAETLGLARDDEAMHAERLKMWNEFNTCWLAVLQKQKEMTQEMQATGQRPLPPQSMIDYNYMEHMGRELVRLCDLMEKHGLVDYQLGVWEEEIINLLTHCLDLLEDPNRSSSASANTQPGPSTSSSRRR